ncbi:MAG: amidohydrolase family protein, partial [Nodosilinea sp.]
MVDPSPPIQSSFSYGIRGAILDFIDDPFFLPAEQATRYLADGLLVIRQGYVAAWGPYQALRADWSDLPITDYSGKLITPGLIDTHIHYPQTGMIASYGEQLLEWLESYTFPTERQFADPDYAAAMANLFLDELLKNGTTTAL